MTWAHYLLQANIYLVVFYAFYKLLLEQETYFQFNRAYLIISGVLALAIPFIQLDWLTQQPVSQQISVTVGQLEMMVLPDQGTAGVSWGDVVALIYTAGLFVFSIRFCLQLWFLGKRFYGRDRNHAVQQGTAYSFLSRKVVDKNLPCQDIISHHEDVHLKQFHSIDVLLFELITILNWFNPVVYLYKKALKDNHEYLADEATASYQGDREHYSLLLLSAAFKISPHALTNSFFSKQSLIKKRIYMLHKEKSKRRAVLKYGLYLPVFSGMLLLSSANMRENPEFIQAMETIPFNDPITAVKNALPLTDAAAMRNDNAAQVMSLDASIAIQEWEPFYAFVARNIKYPEQARRQQIQGNAQTKFTLENGAVKTLEVLTKLGAGIDAEVMKTILSFKNFKDQPDGNYVLNVTFKLNGANTAMQNEPIKPVDGFTNLKQVTVLGSVNATAQANSSRSEVMDFVAVDTPPSFPGGISQFYDFIAKSVKYPAEAVKNNVEGKVYLSYVVEKDGTLSDIQLAGKKLGYGTDEEAVRVLKLSPRWNPGLVDGKPVAVKYHIPISFTLSEKTKANSDTKESVEHTTLNGKVSNVVVVKTTGSNAEMRIGSINVKDGKEPIYIIDGVVATKQAMEKLSSNDIQSIHVNKADTDVDGKKESSGTVNIITKRTAK